jgi:hypothetical protein
MNELMAGLVSAVVSGVVGLLVSWAVTRWTIQTQDRTSIDAELNKCLELAMTYPHLEREAYCSKWPNVLDGDDKDRYICFCCCVFNTLEHVWLHCKGNPDKVREIVRLEPYIRSHYRWWEHSSGTDEHYDSGFCEHVQRIIDQLRQNGKIQ